MSNHDDLLGGIDQIEPLSHRLAVIHHALDAVRCGTHELTEQGLIALCHGLADAIAASAHMEGLLLEAVEALQWPAPKPTGANVVSLFGGPISAPARLPVPARRALVRVVASDGDL